MSNSDELVVRKKPLIRPVGDVIAEYQDACVSALPLVKPAREALERLLRWSDQRGDDTIFDENEATLLHRVIDKLASKELVAHRVNS